MNLGEKIETILLSRKNGVYGDYIGLIDEKYEQCLVDDVIYNVTRNVEIDTQYWCITNKDTNEIAFAPKNYIGLITEASFS